FFFFQAEDGIRDKLVTGVQTCALPIFGLSLALLFARFDRRIREPEDLVAIYGHPLMGVVPESAVLSRLATTGPRSAKRGRQGLRSEERRVGKECRSRRSSYEEKKEE